MTSARGHGAFVYCLNSGSGDSQTGRHNGERGKGEEKGEDGRERRERGGKKNGERRRKRKWKETEKERKKSRRERERSPPCMEKRAESGDWSEKDDERRWR
ncbi:hypothetical protein TNCV_506521 [Trichonephila clavipes]|nr:hypothetical protein TNCV_506521 [Trichonephila clavipes]